MKTYSLSLPLSLLLFVFLFSSFCFTVLTEEKVLEVVHDVLGVHEYSTTLGSTEEAKGTTQPPSNKKRVIVFPNGGNNTEDKQGVELVLKPGPEEGEGVYFESLIDLARYCLPGIYPELLATLDEKALKELPLSIHNRYSTKLQFIDEIKDGDLLYLIKGEDFFFWPGVYIGHRVPLINVNSGVEGKVLELVTLSLEPRAFLIPDFVTDEECKVIIEYGEKTIAPSRSIIGGKDATETARNSEHTWLGREYDNVLELDRRVGQTTLVSHALNNDELLQVLRYLPNQHYYAHTDFFKSEYFEHQQVPRDRNRMITLLFYLNTPEEGGETAFFNVKGYPAYGKTWGEFNTSDCGSALRVTPRKGDAVLFYNLVVDHHMDPIPLGDENSHHAGCDVIKGVKWAANKWIWNRPFPFPLHTRV